MRCFHKGGENMREGRKGGKERERGQGRKGKEREARERGIGREEGEEKSWGERMR